ncbi:hypothetical protein HZB74_03790 [Candidatus Saccharibacteria bacterium]|nr:hypothetical protein [Candidatus Saccharibacteria bacterium]
MARLISEILKEKEPDFSYRLAHFEKLAGSPSIDIRLISEMTTRFQRMAKSLGLDEIDTTARELFFALNKKAIEDSKALAKKIGVHENDDSRLMTEKCVKYISNKISKTKIWSVKSSTLKRDLKTNPPKKLLKVFGLRSIDSALKRVPLGEILIFARLLESKTWQSNYVNSARKITNSDFDLQPIDINILSESRQKKLKGAGIKLNQLVRSDQETGSLVLSVAPKRFDGDILYIVNSLIENINKIKIHSLYLRHKSIQSDFFNVIYNSRLHGVNREAGRHLDVGWDAYTRSKRLNEEKLDEFDFDIEQEHETLDHNDVLDDSFWNNQYLLKSDDDLIISCNLSDVIINAVNGLEPEDSIIHHGQSELRSELYSRYLMHDGVLEYLASSSVGARNYE